MSRVNIGAAEGRKLKKALEDLYKRYDRKKYVDPDPLVFLYDYPDIRDREIAGLISSSLAFGGVRQIMASVGKVLSPMGASPREFVMNTNVKRLSKIYEGFKHRWATSDDIVQMLDGVRTMTEKYGSLEKGFTAGMDEDDEDVIPAMTRFASRDSLRRQRRGRLPDTRSVPQERLQEAQPLSALDGQKRQCRPGRMETECPPRS